MRGRDRQGSKLFSYVSPEALVPQDHPLRRIKRLADSALDRLSADFAALHASTGRPSIPPEQLMRALLLQAFFSVRSERQLMQQISCNMLFRWFIGRSMDAPVWT
jgi:transposase